MHPAALQHGLPTRVPLNAVRRIGSDPSRFDPQISRLPDRREAKTIRAPSGEGPARGQLARPLEKRLQHSPGPMREEQRPRKPRPGQRSEREMMRRREKEVRELADAPPPSLCNWWEEIRCPMVAGLH
jgi:hypothetical protein